MIAVTGGIGSGKSVALSIIADAGYKTLTCDGITKDLYEKRKIKLKLKKLFPTAVKGFFNPQIDRKELSKIVFENGEKLKTLTNTITPLVMQEVLNRAKKFGQTVFVEVPLLFECGYEKYFDSVLVITRPLKDRIESVKTRSNLTEEQIIARINAQVDYENKDLSPYSVIINDSDQLALKEKVLSLVKRLINE